MLGIDVRSSQELQAVVLALRGADRDVQRLIRDQSRRVVLPEWQRGLSQRVGTRLEARLAGTGRARVSNQTVQLQAGGVKGAGSKTADMRVLNRAVEFGANRGKVTTYTRRGRKGGTHRVTRHTARQLRPNRRSGYVVYPTAANLIPRLASLWVQTAVRGLHDVFERRPF